MTFAEHVSIGPSLHTREQVHTEHVTDVEKEPGNAEESLHEHFGSGTVLVLLVYVPDGLRSWVFFSFFPLSVS